MFLLCVFAASAQVNLQPRVVMTNSLAGGGGLADYTNSIGGYWVADDISGANNDPVSSWTARANSLDLSQANGPEQALLQTAAVNGHKSVLFDGSNDSVQRATVTGSALFHATKVTMIFVMKITSNTNTTRANLYWQEGVGATRVLGYAHLDDSKIYFRHGDANLGFANPGSYSNNWCIVEYVRDGANVEILHNGTSLGTSSGQSGSVDTAQTATLGIGVNLAAGNYFKGEIAEIRIWPDAVSSGNRSTARVYLGDRYGITVTP